MALTVFHNLTATTPDDPSAEIRPSHWNSAHAVSLSLGGTDIIGAFSNDPAVNISFSTNAGGFVIASANVTAAPSPVNVTGANGSSVNAQTIAFSNSNGMTLGVSTGANGATVTGSYTVPNVPAQTAFVLSNSNGISFGTNGSTVTATVRTDYQSAGAYLTTAMQSNQSSNFAATGFTTTTIAGSVVAGTQDTNGLKLAVPAYLTTTPAQTAFVFSNSNGVSFGTNGSTVTATVATNYQSQGAYLTTARASNDALGLATAQSNVTWTANSAGVSLDARGYAGTNTGFTGANVSGSMTLNSAGLSLSLSAGAGGGGGFTGGVSTGGNTSGQTGTQTGQIVFAGGNNITLSVATAAGGNQTITISGPNAGGAQTGISGVVVSNTTYTSGTISFSNANGISFGSSAGQAITASYTVPIQSVQPVAISGSNGSFTYSTATFGALNGLTFYTSNGSVVGSYTVPTVPTSYVSQVNGSSGAVSMAVGSSLSSSTNGSSITWGLASNITTALQSAGAYLTTAAQSSVSNVSLINAATNNTGGGTASLSGAVSFSAANGLTFYTSAGNAIVGSYSVPTVTQYFSNTATTFNGANISGSMTHNTAGLQLSLSVAAPGGGAAVTASASNGSFTVGTLGFSNANNVTFGTSAGGIITASVAAPGAAAENNWINLLGANTAGNTTASGSTIGYSGINLTLSGTNGSVVNISAPATSSLVGTNGISIATAGSTISVSGIGFTASDFEPIPMGNNSSFSSFGLNTLYFQGIRPNYNVSMTAAELLMSLSSVTSAISHVANHTFSYGLYSKGSGTNSSRYESMATSSFSIGASYSSNLSGTIQAGAGASSYSSSSAGTALGSNFSGQKILSLPLATVMSAGQDYYFCFAHSSATTGNTGAVRPAFMVLTNQTNGSYGIIATNTIAPFNATITNEPMMVIYTATSGAWPATIAKTQFNAQSANQLYMYIEA